MNRYGFKGLRAVISGGTSGIGLKTAEYLLRDGAEVYILGRSRNKGELAADYLRTATGRTAQYLQCDVQSYEQCRNVFKEIAENIDLLVASAGIYAEERLENLTEASYSNIFDTNVKGLMYFIQAGLGWLKDGSSIVTVASDAGISGNYGCPVYCASKGAVVAFTKALALDLAPRTRVNCVCPADIDTPLLDKQLAACGSSYTKNDMAEVYPLGRIGRSEEVAHVICSAGSPLNSFMTGSIIAVDGGLTAK